MWQNKSNSPVCGNISQTDLYVAISFKLSHICVYQWNSNICGIISKMICMWQYQSNWVRSVYINYMWQNQSKWLICSNICQNESHVSISAKLNYIRQNESNLPVCGNISQTEYISQIELYESIAVKLKYMWQNPSHVSISVTVK